MSVSHFDAVLQYLERHKVFLEVIIGLQNCFLIWDVASKHEMPWGKLVFLGATLLVLLAIIALNRRPMTVSPKIQLDISQAPAKIFATNRLNELLSRGDYLAGQVPQPTATGADLCNFWREQVRLWGDDVAGILTQNWNQQAQQDFYSMRGSVINQPAPAHVNKEVSADFNMLNRRLQNLEQLRRTLP